MDNFSQLQGGDSLSPGQYRPLTVPSNILRILTVRMANRMSDIVERNGLLGPHQFGFRKNRSTLDAVFLLNTILKKAKSKN